MLRRAERRVRPWLHAPLAPLRKRFQRGVRTAVDSSASADTIRDIDRRLSAVETALESIGRVAAETQRVLASLQNPLAAMSSFEQQFAVRFERLQLGVDAVRLDHQGVEAAIRQEFEAVRLDHRGVEAVIRQEFDAARQDHQGAEAAIRQEIDAARLDHQGAEAAIRQEFEAVRSRLLADATHSQQVYADLLAVAGVTLQRADLLVQRAAIPLGGDVLVRTPFGFLLAPAEDEGLLAAMYESGGRLEPGTVGVISALLGEGDWAVDVGANIGATVLPAARQVGPTGRVIAVEPASRVGNLLRRSILINGLQDRISLHACAAGEAVGRAELNLGPITGHSSLLALPEADRTEFGGGAAA